MIRIFEQWMKDYMEECRINFVSNKNQQRSKEISLQSILNQSLNNKV